MKEIDKYFELFVEFLETEDGAGRAIPDYEELCTMIGAPERELDDYLKENFGVSGSGAVRCYRTSTPIAFL